VKKSTKAALLSGLVFPGIGHMYLKRYVPGTILCAGSLSAIYYIVSVVMTTAFEVVNKVQNNNVSLDIGAITELVSQQLAKVEQPTNMAMIALVIFWIIGIVDSYRQGRALEKGQGENH